MNPTLRTRREEQRRTVGGRVRLFLLDQWKDLARMRTSVTLLAIVAALSIVATLLPQKALQPQRASDWIQTHQVLGPLFDNLGLFAVYESWPLLGAALLMYVSLTNCVLTRSRALSRRWRRGLPKNPQFWGEAGSLVFHLSFFVLLAGILWGKAAGFTAFVNVVEGQSVVEARPSYDQIEEGVLFSEEQHRGFEVRVDSFSASYYDSGKPRLFNSHVEVMDGGRKVGEQDIQVNQYLEHDGVKFYQANYGWAPEIRVTNPEGKVVYDAPTLFFSDPQFAKGVMKIPAAGPPGEQLAARMFFVPDVRYTDQGAAAGSAELRNPLLDMAVFKGDLQDRRVQNVYDLDFTRLQQIYTGAVVPGQVAHLPNGYTVTVPRVLRYTSLQVTRDPGVPIIWFSFAMMLGGLLVRLYLRPAMEAAERRRAPASGGLQVGPGGSAAPPRDGTG